MIVGGTQQVIAGRGGVENVGAKHTAYANSGLRPGHVIVGGIETTVDVALREGLISPEEAAKAGFKSPAERVSPAFRGVPAGIVPNIGKGAQQPMQDTAQESAQGQQEPSGGDAPDDTQQAREAAAKSASDTLQSIERAYGPETVDAGLDEVADSGYLPEADQLPEGVTLDHVERVIAGYTAQANDALSGVGATVDMMMETLTDDELREARRATILGDAAKLQHLGQQSVGRLASLPSVDPEGFAEMVESMRPKEREALSQNGKGEWIVTIPGRPAMSFGAAVQAGIVRV